jgi:hypothetical protein
MHIRPHNFRIIHYFCYRKLKEHFVLTSVTEIHNRIILMVATNRYRFYPMWFGSFSFVFIRTIIIVK